MRRDDPGEARDGRAPALEPVAGEVLDQVGEDCGAAGAMEEYRFRHRETAAHENLIDVRRPVRIGRVAQVAIEGEILSPPSQSRRGEETRIGIGGLPLG